MIGPRIRDLQSVLDHFAVTPETPMREVLAVIDKNGEGVALVISEERELLGIVTDGDIRRGILAQLDFEEPVRIFIDHKTQVIGKKPLAAPADLSAPDMTLLMEVRLVRHLPLLDDEQKIVGLALRRDPAKTRRLPLRAVVMAGGLGSRLRPFTEDTPKPLLPVGDKPVIERTIDQLRNSGVYRVSITTHYHAEKIEEHFGDGRSFGIDLSYTHETEPLGTAGALAGLRGGGDPLLVINGDILTAVDYGAMLDFHREHGATITVGVRKYEMSVPFGVLDVEGAAVTGLREKPSYSLFINAGIYLLEASVLDLIPEGRRSDMTDLIQAVLDSGSGKVISFPIHEYWIDIGQLQDYMRAQVDAASGKFGR